MAGSCWSLQLLNYRLPKVEHAGNYDFQRRELIHLTSLVPHESGGAYERKR